MESSRVFLLRNLLIYIYKYKFIGVGWSFLEFGFSDSVSAKVQPV